MDVAVGRGAFGIVPVTPRTVVVELFVSLLLRELAESERALEQLLEVAHGAHERLKLGTRRDRELDDDEVQPSLALGSRSVDDLDEFGDDETQDDDDELI